MGALGSKENLGQIVVIYGYNANDFRWREAGGQDSRSIYHTSGLIIEYDGKKYVVTTRERLISCKNIVMYHSYFRGTEPVMRNDLQILFQCIEYNLIILGTKDRSELDLSMSEVILGDYEAKAVCPSYDACNKKFVVPTKKSHYYTVRMDMDLKSETINYKVHIYDAKFMKSTIYDMSFVPENYMYNFTIINTGDTKFIGICGAIIFNKKHQLVGMVTKSKGNDLYVLPTKALTKILINFGENLLHPTNYNGLLSIPIMYKSDKKIPRISEDCVLETTTGSIKLSKNDKIISIDNNNVIVESDQVKVFDNDYRDNIPLDIYLRLNTAADAKNPTNIVLYHKKQAIDINVLGSKESHEMTITNQSSFFPAEPIPYINFKGMIIVELTQELLDLTLYNQITLKNRLIDDFFNDDLNDRLRLIIIDCLDKKLADEHKFPRLELKPTAALDPQSKQTLECPIIKHINGKELYSLEELSKFLATQDTKFTITVELSDTNYTISI